MYSTRIGDYMRRKLAAKSGLYKKFEAPAPLGAHSAACTYCLLGCAVLYCTALHCTVLYYTILYQ